MNVKFWKDLGTFRVWFRGLIAAAIGGAANGVAAIIVDVDHFNFSTGLGQLGKIALIGAIISAAAYLKLSPMPGQQAVGGLPPPGGNP